MTNKILALLFFASLIACESTDEQRVNDDAAISKQQAVNGKFLASATPSPGVTVGFWELEPGLVYILKESDETETVSEMNFKDVISAERSVVDIYKDIAKKNVNAVHLKALKAAQLVREEVALQHQPQHELKLLNAVADQFENSSARTAAVDRSNCQPDHYNDNYGAQWFKDTYGPSTKSLTNQHEIVQTAMGKNVYFAGMAADFAAEGRFSTFHMNANLTQWIVDNNNLRIRPRKVLEGFYLSSRANLYRVDVIGQSPCSRVHYLQRVK